VQIRTIAELMAGKGFDLPPANITHAQVATAIGAAIGSQPDVDRPRVSGAGPADLAALGME